MSAIAGILYRDGRPVDAQTMGRMSESLAHRGFDDSGAWCDGPIGLVNRLRWTTPESVGEKMPCSKVSGGLVITADARIDNRNELILSLGLDSAVTDSQIVLEAYERWGQDSPDKLIGDFAFAIWDGRNQSVFLARDAMGVKPLYYYLTDRILVFASEIKAILQIEEVPVELNDKAVEDHLLGQFDDTTQTFYSGIMRVEPGHSMTVKRKSYSSHRYWLLDSEFELRLRSDAEYSEALRDQLRQAVKCRLRSAFPIGSTLSGGLDSSSIACLARGTLAEEGRPRLRTYSAIFPSLPPADLRKIDERRFVDEVLRTGDFEATFVRADEMSPLIDLDTVLWHQDQPFLAPNLYMHWSMYGAASKDGVRVFLDGLDGDTTVSHGLTYLSELTRKGRFIRLFRECRELSKKSPNRSFTPRRIAWEFGIRDLISPRTERLARWLLRRPPTPPPAESKPLNPSFADRRRENGKPAPGASDETRKWQTTRQAHYDSLTFGLIPYTLEIADKAASAFGIEPRYPFFDRRLVEFCLAVPPDQKLMDGWTRSILRRAMTGILPPAVQWRVGKSNLAPNFKRRLLERERALIDQTLGAADHVLFRYADRRELQKAYDRYSSDPMTCNEESIAIYSALVLGAWLRFSASKDLAAYPGRPTGSRIVNSSVLKARC